jgi:hypothetical protein
MYKFEYLPKIVEILEVGMNHFRQGIRDAIVDSEFFQISLESEIDEITSEIYLALLPNLAKIVIMRNLQRAYFRRRNEDTLSKAKRAEIEVDLLLVGIHNNSAQIEIPIEVRL